MKIYPRHYETIQMTLKRLRKFCDQSGITKELKKRAYYEKPSEVRRRKMRKAIKQAQQLLLEQKNN